MTLLTHRHSVPQWPATHCQLAKLHTHDGPSNEETRSMATPFPESQLLPPLSRTRSRCRPGGNHKLKSTKKSLQKVPSLFHIKLRCCNDDLINTRTKYDNVMIWVGVATHADCHRAEMQSLPQHMFHFRENTVKQMLSAAVNYGMLFSFIMVSRFQIFSLSHTWLCMVQYAVTCVVVPATTEIK